LVKEQIKTIEAEQAQQVAAGGEARVAQLARLRAVGRGGAWVLVKEVFGWRALSQSARIGSCLGAHGHALRERRERNRARHQPRPAQAGEVDLVELAWSWLRYQPDSDLSNVV